MKSKHFITESSNKIGIATGLGTLIGSLGTAAYYKTTDPYKRGVADGMEKYRTEVLPYDSNTSNKLTTPQKITMGIGLIGSTVLATRIITNIVKNNRLKKCENYSDEAKKNECYIKVNKEIIDDLRSNIKECDKSKDPEKCREMVNIKINIVKKKINKKKDS